MNEIKRNNSIDIFRIVCALMVVTIHTDPFVQINANLSYIITEVITKIAVPYFFCVSGYWYIKKLREGKKCFRSSFLGVLKIYVFWTIIYYIRSIVVYIGYGMGLKEIAASFIVEFFVSGSSYHFWYFISLLLAISVTTAVYKTKSKPLFIVLPILLYIIGLLGTPYYSLGTQIPLFSDFINIENFYIFRRNICTGIPFFMLGGLIPAVYEKEQSKNTGIKLIISIILFFSENFIIKIYNLGNGNVITIFLPLMPIYIMVFMLKHPLNNWTKLGNLCRTVANWTYYIHPMLIYLFIVITDNNMLRHLAVVSICLITGILISKSRKLTKFLMLQ